ncbi:MAG: hypothetical protein HY566_00840 [Candidatus Kerfeldbacteria bacterium]|nr:hypothetical protein [Candidatus Kerfeldbacteria bacterium]
MPPPEGAKNLCDTCRLRVDPWNDVAMLEAVLRHLRGIGTRGILFFLYGAAARHIMPVMVGDIRLCEGSPSRAQYLGCARDPRSTYPLSEELQELYQHAYLRLQGHYGKAPATRT